MASKAYLLSSTSTSFFPFLTISKGFISNNCCDDDDDVVDVVVLVVVISCATILWSSSDATDDRDDDDDDDDATTRIMEIDSTTVMRKNIDSTIATMTTTKAQE